MTTAKQNGARLAAPQDDTYKGQKVTELILDSGEMVYVKSLSVYIRRGLKSKAEALYPYPDKGAYEILVDPEKAAIPGMTHPAEDNPEYQAVIAEIEDTRLQWYIDHLISEFCEWPAGKESLIAKYAEQVKSLSDILDIEGDEWEATWRYCLIGDADRNNIIQAANGNLILTEGEVRDAMRIFRPVVQGSRHPDRD